ncbi:hypothetical protein HUK38_06010 [Thiospirillum jenense]|uniref:Uncharacterized protein n=1 Tax=Thiospirillum jenense TaxID=1653858 RepID=A0A839HEG6_9GAMM|nr:hypothetical protein [Thiospirillum jenense]
MGQDLIQPPQPIPAAPSYHAPVAGKGDRVKSTPVSLRLALQQRRQAKKRKPKRRPIIDEYV